MPGGDPIRFHPQSAEHARITEVGEIRSLVGRHLHADQRQGTSGSQEMGGPQGAVAPRLNGFRNRVFR